MAQQTDQTIQCAACEGTGRIHDASCPDKAEHVCETRCEICDGEGTLDFGMVKYWFDQSQQMSTRVHQEQLARIDAELELYHSQYEAERATRVRRAA